MYSGLEKIGFRGGRVLEPSAGIGHFNGAMPANLKTNSRWTMVELDTITGGIAKHLYPSADVRVMGFEKANLPDNYFDAAISNVPFGNYGISDRAYPNTVTGSIHNYFFAKSLDKVRPGGVVAFITSSFTMDEWSPDVRQYLMQRADLLGAVRLPNTAFRSNAGTSVVTDILVLKKREPGTPYAGEPFADAGYSWNGGMNYVQNEYFKAHPEMVLGTPTRKNGMYGRDSLTYDPLDTKTPLGKQIENALSNITATMDYPKQRTQEEIRREIKRDAARGKVGGIVKRDGKLYKRNQDGELVDAGISQRDTERMSAAVALRDAARALVEFQLDGAKEETVANSRRGLNGLYDDFVKRYGPLHSKKNKALIRNDVDAPFILALEDYNEKTKEVKKSDIFFRNTVSPRVTVSHADTVEEALAVAMNETGSVDPARIAQLTGQNEADVRNSLLENGLAFLNRDGNLEMPERYLSGNVRAKLKEAEALAEGNPEYRRNVEALKKVIPPDIAPEDIRANLGATWVPDSVYTGFVEHLLGGWGVKVRHEPLSHEFLVTVDKRSSAKYSPANTTTWGTPQESALDILTASLNNRELKVWAKTEDGGKVLDAVATQAVKQKQEAMQQEFQSWLWQDEKRREAVGRLYNDVMNNTAIPQYDGRNITVNGANPAFPLRGFQKDAVYRALFAPGNMLLDHCVGAGKSYTMASIAMKLRQTGLARKPAFVVPKGLVAQWGEEFYKFYPAAKILVLGEHDFNPQNRQEYANRIATGDYDAVILSYEQFEKIPVSEETTEQFYQREFDQLEAGIEAAVARGERSKKSESVKSLEKAKANLKKQLDRDMDRARRDTTNIRFEQLGVDAVFVDESHNFKNLRYASHMDRIGGMGNQIGSVRAADMYLKTQYLQQMNGGRGVYFATATPVMNSLTEMYNVLRYLAPNDLEARGINSFDDFANQFAEVSEITQPKISGGGFQTSSYLTKFVNLGELQQLFRSSADVVRELPQEVKVPKMKGGKRITVECEPSEFQLQYFSEMAERANAKNPKDPMVKIYTDGRKIAISQRMIDPSLPLEENGKIVKCTQTVYDVWKETTKGRGTQIIFADLGVPKKEAAPAETDVDPNDAAIAVKEDASAVSVYGDLKNQLVGLGIPPDEIAFIHDADSQEKRKQLFKDMNEGNVRVLIGSTEKMGVGMNAQERVAAIHHLNPPHRPGDIEQREGRGLRQGNRNEEVAVYVYTTEKSIDARMWHNLNRKARGIDQIQRGDLTAREMEGDSEFAISAAEISAIASGDPLLLEQYNVVQTINKLENAQRAHQREVFDAQKRIRQANAAIVQDTETAAHLKADIDARVETKGGSFALTVGGKTYTERKAGGEALLSAAGKVLREKPAEPVEIGSFAGFSLLSDSRANLLLRGQNTYQTAANFQSATGTIQSLEAVPRKLDAMLSATQTRLEANRAAVPELQKTVNAPFAKAKELEQARIRNAEIMDEMKRQAHSRTETPDGQETAEADNGEAVQNARDSRFPNRPERWTAERVGKRDAAPMRLSDLIEKYRHAWGIHVTTGQIRGADIRGQYRDSNHGVRLKIANDLPTLAHELGHYLDHAYGLSGNAAPAPARAELVNNLAPDFADQYQNDQLPGEGVAEFCRRFLQNRETAAIDYPEFYNHLMTTLPGTDQARLLAMADEVNAYYSLDADTAQSAIRHMEEPRPDSRSRREKLADTYDRVAQTTWDALHSVKKLSQEIGSDVYKRFYNAAYADSMSHAILTGDLRDPDGQYVGPGLKTALHGVRLNDTAEYDAFGEYLVCRHGPTWLERGRTVFADDRKNSSNFMARRVAELETQYPAFHDAGERLDAFWDSLMQTYAVNTGLLSQEAYDALREMYPHYVPFYRAMDKAAKGRGSNRGFANQTSTVRYAKGSGRDIVHPIDNIISTTAKIVYQGVHQRAMLDLVDAVEELHADAAWMEKVPMPVQKHTASVAGMKADIKNQVLESDLSEEAKQTLYDIIDGEQDLLEYWGRGRANGNVITLLRNGKPEYWQVNDPLLLESLTTMGRTELNFLVKGANTVSRFITGNLTGRNIVWSIFSNFPRDLQTAIIYSTPEHRAKLIPAMLSGYANAVNKARGSANVDPLYLEYLAMGGDQTRAYSGDKNLSKSVRMELQGPQTRQERFLQTVSAPLRAIDWVSDTVEQGPRWATYKLFRQDGADPQTAFRAAMEITVDFRKGGALSRNLNAFIPFFNAGLQGTVKDMGAITGQDVPPEQRKSVVRGRVLAFLASSLLAAAVQYGMNNWNEDLKRNYQRLSTYTKNSYICIPLFTDGKPNGKYFCFPKARGVAIPENVFERLMERYAGGNRHVFEGFQEYAASAEFPNVASDILSFNFGGIVGGLAVIGPAVQALANQDFLGRPIESAADRNNSPAMRYNERTSALAKVIGSAFNISPKMLDHFGNNVMGAPWKYQQALLPVAPAERDLSLGVKGQYVKDSLYSTDVVNRLYDLVEKSAQAAADDPDDVDKKITSKMDSTMTAFYGRYYALAKSQTENNTARELRDKVLTMMEDYQAVRDSGEWLPAQEAVFDVCRKAGDTAYLLPTVRENTVKDGSGTVHALTAAQFYDYQGDYNKIYWEAVGKALPKVKTDEEKEAVLKAAADAAGVKAKNNVLIRLGKPTTKEFEKFETLELYSIPLETYLTAKVKADGLESLKDKKGNTISNSDGAQIAELVLSMDLTLPGTSQKKLMELLGVGKTVREWSESKLRRELSSMRRKAA